MNIYLVKFFLKGHYGRKSGPYMEEVDAENARGAAEKVWAKGISYVVSDVYRKERETEWIYRKEWK